MSTLVVGSSRHFGTQGASEPFIGTVAAGFIRACRYVAPVTGYVSALQLFTSSKANTGVTSVIMGITLDEAGTIRTAALGQATFVGEPGKEEIIEAVLEKPIKITIGTVYWIQILPIGGSLFIPEEFKVTKAGTECRTSSSGSKAKIEGSAYGAGENTGPITVAGIGTLRLSGTGPIALLRDLQLELPILARWMLNEEGPAPGVNAVDDIKEIKLASVHKPLLNRPGMNKDDTYTSVMGGYSMKGGSTAELHYFSNASLPAGTYNGIFGGFTIEAITAAEPNGNKFALIKLANQFEVKIEGTSITFVLKVTTPKTYTLTATAKLSGYPQLIQCIYDSAGKTQSIWVDGVMVASQAAEGAVNNTLNEALSILEPAAAVVTEAVAQDLALYNCVMNKVRIQQHLNAFRQIQQDPGHVRI